MCIRDRSRLSIVKNHDNTYIRDGLKSLELQSKWIPLSKYPLPNKKYVKELDSSITLSVPLVENDELYAFFKYLDDFVESQNLCPNKKQNKFIKQKKDPKGATPSGVNPEGATPSSVDQTFLKIKLYITTNVFIHGDTNPKINYRLWTFTII